MIDWYTVKERRGGEEKEGELKRVDDKVKKIVPYWT